jgi:hypothetical protein
VDGALGHQRSRPAGAVSLKATVKALASRLVAQTQGEFRLQIGNPGVIAPATGIDRNGMRTFVVA